MVHGKKLRLVHLKHREAGPVLLTVVPLVFLFSSVDITPEPRINRRDIVVVPVSHGGENGIKNHIPNVLLEPQAILD